MNIPETARAIMDFMGCECEFVPAGKSVEEITRMYDNLVADSKAGGYTPLIVSADDFLRGTLSFVMEGIGEGKTLADYRKELLSAELIDVQKWFSQNDAPDEAFLEQMDLEREEFLKETDGADTSSCGFCGFIDYNTQKSCDVILAKIPTVRPWEVFAWVPFGGWNECPAPDVMMAVSKYWYEKYGAVPATISYDVLEYTAKPAGNIESAKQLAYEQGMFCMDIIDQGVGSFGVLADMLINSTVWYFWWD